MAKRCLISLTPDIGALPASVPTFIQGVADDLKAQIFQSGELFILLPRALYSAGVPGQGARRGVD